MKANSTFAPSPRVVKNKDTTTLWVNIGYDQSDAKLESFSLKKFKSFIVQRFPKIKHDEECARIRVLIRLDPDHEIRFDGELQDTTCRHVEEIVGDCQPLITGTFEAGFQKDLREIEQTSALLEETEKLIKSISHELDVLRGMRVQFTIQKASRFSVWEFAESLREQQPYSAAGGDNGIALTKSKGAHL